MTDAPENAFSPQEKVIVVTGGTGILGDSVVNGIVEAGGAVAIVGRKADVAPQRAEAITARGGRALAVVADVLEESQLRAACQQGLAAFGRIAGLVNGAGVNGPDGVLAPETDVFQLALAGMRRVMDLNRWGTLLPTQVWLLPAASRFVTGSMICVDGGFSIFGGV